MEGANGMVQQRGINAIQVCPAFEQNIARVLGFADAPGKSSIRQTEFECVGDENAVYGSHPSMGVCRIPTSAVNSIPRMVRSPTARYFRGGRHLGKRAKVRPTILPYLLAATGRLS